MDLFESALGAAMALELARDNFEFRCNICGHTHPKAKLNWFSRYFSCVETLEHYLAEELTKAGIFHQPVAYERETKLEYSFYPDRQYLDLLRSYNALNFWQLIGRSAAAAAFEESLRTFKNKKLYRKRINAAEILYSLTGLNDGKLLMVEKEVLKSFLPEVIAEMNRQAEGLWKSQLKFYHDWIEDATWAMDELESPIPCDQVRNHYFIVQRNTDTRAVRKVLAIEDRSNLSQVSQHPKKFGRDNLLKQICKAFGLDPAERSLNLYDLHPDTEGLHIILEYKDEFLVLCLERYQEPIIRQRLPWHPKGYLFQFKIAEVGIF